jgi:hypothetical protein
VKKQIASLSPHQSAKVVGILYFVCTLPFVLFGAFALLFPSSHESSFPFGFMFFAPVIYGVLGYLFFALFCWVYNQVAKRVGGVEFTVVELPEA